MNIYERIARWFITGGVFLAAFETHILLRGREPTPDFVYFAAAFYVAIGVALYFAARRK